MKRVRIVGGGLTGLLAAFEAHRLGARDIVLHERAPHLGGVAMPRVADGLPLRPGCIYFGPRGDPVRDLLDQQGLDLIEFANRFGSVSPTAKGDARYAQDFGGPALDCPDAVLAPPRSDTLAARLGAYPHEIGAALARYCRWHLGAQLDEVHGAAATPLGINRVFPVGPDVADLAAAKRDDALWDELYAIPRSLWDRGENGVAALPRDGFAAFFRDCGAALARLGVTVHHRSRITPQALLQEADAQDVVVWAANPTPLFRAVGVPVPALVHKRFCIYNFRARWSGPTPFYAQKFTAEGSVFRAYIYAFTGETLLTAECVRPAPAELLRAELADMMRGFGDLEVGEAIGAAIQPRWIYNSMDVVQRTDQLLAAMAGRFGSRFVAGAWEAYGQSEKFAEVAAGLSNALEIAPRRAARA